MFCFSIGLGEVVYRVKPPVHSSHKAEPVNSDFVEIAGEDNGNDITVLF